MMTHQNHKWKMSCPRLWYVCGMCVVGCMAGSSKPQLPKIKDDTLHVQCLNLNPEITLQYAPEKRVNKERGPRRAGKNRCSCS